MGHDVGDETNVEWRKVPSLGADGAFQALAPIVCRAARALGDDDRFGTILGPDALDVVCKHVEGLVPGDFLELSLAALAYALERFGHASLVRMNEPLRDAASAKRTPRNGVVLVTFDADDVIAL